MQQEVLGVDIGGVIIDRVNDNTDTSFFGNNYLKSTAMPGVFEALAMLTRRFPQIYLVSKCGEKTERKTGEWLAHHRFFERTGIPKGNARFCRERRDKAIICSALRITHFIDDRLEVLSYLTNVRVRYLFAPQASEMRKFASFLPQVKRVESWSEVLQDFFPR